MRYFITIFIFSCLVFFDASAQKSKNKKNKLLDGKPKIMEVFGDSLRRDSIVYYETEIGYTMPDFSQKFKGKWNINVMRRQARAEPDSLTSSYFEFYDDTLFTAYVGCNKINGYYIIKGPTIKFNITDTAFSTCSLPVEEVFIKLISERVSYFGIDEKTLYLKDVAFNIVFDCGRKNEDEPGKSTYK